MQLLVQVLFALVVLCCGNCATFAADCSTSLTLGRRLPFGGVSFGGPLTLADMDNDGILDVVSSNVTTLVWFRNPGNANFGPARALQSGLGSLVAAVARDFSGDLLPDLVVGSLNSLFYLANNGAGGVLAPVALTSANISLLSWLEAADMNGDGRTLFWRVSTTGAPCQRALWPCRKYSVQLQLSCAELQQHAREYC